MVNSISNTLKRLSIKINLKGFLNLNYLFDGLSIEFSRLIEFKDIILNSSVPNDNMDEDTIDDYNNKYGIQTNGCSSSDCIDRIIERASLSGNGGVDFLQEQIRKAGFDLYVIENISGPDQEIQYDDNDLEYSDSIQYDIELDLIDPNEYLDIDLGKLIVGSPSSGAGKLVNAQYSDNQVDGLEYNDTDLQYDDPDLDATYPRPVPYQVTTNPLYWNFVFFLSPFADRLAETEDELLSLTTEEYNYLYKLVIALKFQRNWCVAQIKIQN